MPHVGPDDRLKTRYVNNQIKLIREHLEAMQRDFHGLEYEPWKREVDHLWKCTFQEINNMSIDSQQVALETIEEVWRTYITHYQVLD